MVNARTRLSGVLSRAGRSSSLLRPVAAPIKSLRALGAGSLFGSSPDLQGGVCGGLTVMGARSLTTTTAAAGSASPAAPAFGSSLSSVSGLSPMERRGAVLDVVRSQVPGHKDAFYVVDLGEVSRKFDQWTSELPRVRPYYAVKCNDDPRIVEVLAARGAGFDCASKGEMAMVLAQGVKPSDIIFAHPAKQVSHLHYAARAGVTRMTFDNEEELRKIAAEYPGAEVVLRILADDSASVCRLGLKFGAPLAEVPHLLSTARDLGLSVAGVSYHVGSGNGSVTAFADAVRDARAAFDIAASLGMTLKLLDIGGGFPGSEMGAAPGVDVLPGRDADASNPYASAPSFPAIAGVVRSALDTHFPEGCGVELIAEPGRYFVKSSHVLAVNVIGKKKTVNDDGSARLNYYVNDGLYGSFNCVLYDHVTCTPSLLLTGPASRLAQGAAAGADDDVIAALGPDGRPVVTDALGLGAAVQLTAAAAVAAAGQAAQAQRRVMRVGGGAELEEVEGEGAAGSGLSASGGHSVRPGAHTVVSGVSGARSTASSSSSSGSGSGSASWSYRALERAASTATSAAAPPLIGGSPVSTTVWGPTCDSMDKISDALSLPELAVGDWLVFENMGAYTIAGSCKFNGFPLTTKVYIETSGAISVTPEEA